MREKPTEMLDYLDYLLTLKIPISFFVFHHEILKDINQIENLDTLFNIDFHSDLADNNWPRESLKLNEGTWVNFVRFRKRGTFFWLYPDISCYKRDGRCDVRRNPFLRNCQEICGWEKTSRRCVSLLTRQEMKSVVKIGICISPNWINKEQRNEALKFFQKNNLVTEKFVRRAKRN
jgi:hypothetical protein